MLFVSEKLKKMILISQSEIATRGSKEKCYLSQSKARTIKKSATDWQL